MFSLLSLCTSRLAVVTGGTRGIGFGIANSLAKSGFNLILGYNSNVSAAHNACQRLVKDHNVRVCCVEGDLCFIDTRRRIFEEVDMSKDDLKVVVHNAGQYIGITSDNSFKLEPHTFMFGDGKGVVEKGSFIRYYQRLYSEAYIDLCEKAIQRMENGGSLIGISSPGCAPHYNPNPGYDFPGSGKCVMEYVNRLMALRVASKGINSNIIVPGVTNTEAWEKLGKMRGKSGDELMQEVSNKIAPMGHMTPDQLGECVSFLCEGRGKWITGLTIPVDGGVHLKI